MNQRAWRAFPSGLKKSQTFRVTIRRILRSTTVSGYSVTSANITLANATQRGQKENQI
jgi:hypothetical protein